MLIINHNDLWLKQEIMLYNQQVAAMNMEIHQELKLYILAMALLRAEKHSCSAEHSAVVHSPGDGNERSRHVIIDIFMQMQKL